MNASKLSVTLTVILISLSSAFCQKQIKLYEAAEMALSEEDFALALEKYREVALIDPEFRGTEYKLEACQLMVDKERSPETYLALEEAYASDEYYFLWKAKVLMARYLFEDASNSLNTFEQKLLYNGSTEDEDTKKLVAKSQRLVEYFDNPDNYEIHQLEAPVNSDANELSPVYFEEQKELLFASSSKDDPNQYIIYHSIRYDGGWGKPSPVKNLGVFTQKNANIEVVNEDGKLFIFREENGGDLFYSQSSGDTWTVPVEFDSKVSNNQLASHFFINEHEDRIIFSSSNKQTGLDIYESFKDPKNDKWTRPAPFSQNINSSFDEDSPYLSPDEKTLYFISDRPDGVGGMDVYISQLDPSTFQWSEPQNMGWPINSPDNEFHFKMNTDQTSGYFVSDRLHSKGGYDIYFFWEVEKVKITGRLIDNAGKPLTDAQIRFHPSQYSEEYFHSKSNENGIYETTIISDEIFDVEIIKDGHILKKEKFEVHDAKGEAITHHKDFKINE